MEPTPPAAPIPAAPAEPCDRCGAFAKLTRRGEHRYCAACLVRLQDPIESGAVSVGGVLAGGLRLFRKIGLRALMVTCLGYIPWLACFARWPTHERLIDLVFTPLELLVLGAVLTLSRAAVDPEAEPAVLTALGRSFRRLWPVLVLDIMLRITWLIGFLLLIVPGVVLVLSFAVAIPVVLDEPLRGVHALGASYDRMKGHRWVALAAYAISWLPAFFAGVASIVPAVIFVATHHGQRPPLGASAFALAMSYAGRVLLLLLPALVTATLYAKTRPEVRLPSIPPAGPADDEVDELTPEELERLTGPVPQPSLDPASSETP